MRARIETGTGIAMVGAWDASRDESLLTKRRGKEFWQTLESDARTGKIFLIYTEGDGGGPIDIFLDQEIPKSLRNWIRPMPSEFLLRVSSGRLVVGGVEDYRSPKPQITDEDSVVVIPPGDYMLKLFLGDVEAVAHSPSRAELEQAVGAEDFRYYNRIEKQGHLGCLTLLLFPLLWPAVGWLFASGITLAVVLAYFNIREYLFLKRNVRYQRIDRAINEARLKAAQNDSPTFVFQLRKVDYIPGLEGGSIGLGRFTR